ncbi:MAG: DUF4129 domain-containing protein [Anaerolineaceae bacterium]|nr:DUF4129 domain-containing protein [Anaerolineaceae bacterium]
MKCCWRAAISLILSLLPIWGLTVRAQDNSLSVDEFWGRLNQTEVLLRSKLLSPSANTEADSTAAIDEILLLWKGIDQIRLADGHRFAVDLGWIRAALIDGQPDSLAALHRQVKALIDYHDRHEGQTDAINDNVSVRALEDVLRDPRFQYPDITPTPVPDEPRAEVAQSSALASAAQTVLLAAGLVIMIVVFVYFARNLQVQQATIETIPNTDPTTSDDAQTLATDHAQSQDYRTAIRYLYLASLLMLDERGVIHYDATLTNREHLRHVKDKPQLYDVLRQVINAFEEVWYGYLPINEAYYQHFSQQVDELKRMVA